jgi:hypothetical protein
MVLSLQRIFQERESTSAGKEEFEVICSYLEVYNEVRWPGVVQSGLGWCNLAWGGAIAQLVRCTPAARPQGAR